MADDLVYKITLTAKDEASQVIQDAAGRARDASGRFVAMGRDSQAAGDAAAKAQRAHGDVLSGLVGKVGAVAAAYVSFQAALGLVRSLAGGVRALGEESLRASGTAEELRNALNTVTAGHGATWFEQLNAWAKVMPGSTAEAIEAFKRLRSMGVSPTIKDMTVLKDTVTAVGGGDETFMGIVTALGQMQAKGKASAEELMQLAERGVPAYQILQDELGLTGEQVAKIGESTIAVDRVLQALLAGLEKRFGGAATAMQGTWSGMTQTLQSEWDDFARLVGESGFLEFAKQEMRRLLEEIQRLSSSGDLARFARQASDVLTGLGKVVSWTASRLGDLSKAGLELATNASPWLRTLETLARLPGSPLAGYANALARVRTEYEAAHAASEAFQDGEAALAGVYQDAQAAIVEHYDAVAAAASKGGGQEVQAAAQVLDVRRQQRDLTLQLLEQEAQARREALDKAGLAERDHAESAKAVEQDLAQARLSALQAYAAQAQGVYDALSKRGQALAQELASLQTAQAAFLKSSAELVRDAALNAMAPAQKMQALKEEVRRAQLEIQALAAKGDQESLRRAEEQLRSLAGLYKQMEAATPSGAKQKQVAQEAAQGVKAAADVIAASYDKQVAKAKEAQAANDAAAKSAKGELDQAKQAAEAAAPAVEITHNANEVKAEILQTLQGMTTTGEHEVVLRTVDDQARAAMTAFMKPEEKRISVSATTAEAQAAILPVVTPEQKTVTVNPQVDLAAAAFQNLVAPGEKPVLAAADVQGAQESLAGLTAPAEKPVEVAADVEAATALLADVVAPDAKPVNLHLEADAFKAAVEQLTRPEQKVITIVEKRVSSGADSSGSDAAPASADAHDGAAGYRLGGLIPGFGGGDVTPIWVEPGERITDKHTTRHFGNSFFEALQDVAHGRADLSRLLAMLQHREVARLPVHQVEAPPAFATGGLAPQFTGFGMLGGQIASWGSLTLDVDGRSVQAVMRRGDYDDLQEGLMRAKLTRLKRKGSGA